MRAQTRRAGYALVLTLVFITLLFSMFALAHRQTNSAIRLETGRARQSDRDQGSVHALAKALGLLETGPPPSDPYLCAVIIETPDGPRSFSVTFTSEGINDWSVHSAPTPEGQTPDPMPESFGP